MDMALNEQWCYVSVFFCLFFSFEVSAPKTANWALTACEHFQTEVTSPDWHLTLACQTVWTVVRFLSLYKALDSIMPHFCACLCHRNPLFHCCQPLIPQLCHSPLRPPRSNILLCYMQVILCNMLRCPPPGTLFTELPSYSLGLPTSCIIDPRPLTFLNKVFYISFCHSTVLVYGTVLYCIGIGIITGLLTILVYIQNFLHPCVTYCVTGNMSKYILIYKSFSWELLF